MAQNSVLDGHILNIVQNHEIAEQGDLQELLKERGFDIPQATLSRRLKKLKIAKIEGAYRATDVGQAHLPLVLNMQVAEAGLIVLHTHPGQASGLAYFFDQKYVSYSPKDVKNAEILGTIAGDDTVLIILKSRNVLDGVLSAIYGDFPYLKMP